MIPDVIAVCPNPQPCGYRDSRHIATVEEDGGLVLVVPICCGCGQNLRGPTRDEERDNTHSNQWLLDGWLIRETP